MSGITPLLDTLLHQVLGKRVDFQTARETPTPVAPALPAEAARQLRGDAQLDARTPQLLTTPGTPRAESTPTGTPPLPTMPASTATQLSPAARTIADVLLEHPAEPSAISPAAPLLEEDAPLQATTLAGLLKQSISESGLFYESHLARWFHGQHPLQALAREPQMSGWQPRPDNSPGAVQPAPEQPLESLPATLPAEAANKPAAPTAADDNRTAPPQEAAATRDAPPSRNELQDIVRHQLELLVSPTLRWQGEVWAGMFMSLLLQPTERNGNDSPRNDPENDRKSGTGDAPEWSIHLDLELSQHGPLHVDARLAAQRLSLTVVSASDALLDYFEKTRSALHERLLQCGLGEVRLLCRDSRTAPETGDD